MTQYRYFYLYKFPLDPGKIEKEKTPLPAAERIG